MTEPAAVIDLARQGPQPLSEPAERLSSEVIGTVIGTINCANQVAIRNTLSFKGLRAAM
jgi:hypothetical protein